jgi:hypothetical protein
MSAAYFTWVRNRLGQTVPQLYYGQPPTSKNGDKVLVSHVVNVLGDPWSLKLDELAEKYPEPQEESEEVYK